ncbi:hypothetical protein GWI33_005563 [Rhynchophorus ferrugineus]|uniref:Uncharacterized protein n=1 Tax=Rhynchophorus ferrugineus TaxID=354439 RepID=A0A834MDM7_RHYFE|nr:hypothetical protein GWI33_005563 [Rhynchophorus ferrugineus]
MSPGSAAPLINVRDRKLRIRVATVRGDRAPFRGGRGAKGPRGERYPDRTGDRTAGSRRWREREVSNFVSRMAKDQNRKALSVFEYHRHTIYNTTIVTK